MSKFNYILNDLAFDTLVIKCLYAEPTDEDVKECENQIKLLQQENKALKDRIDKAIQILKLCNSQCAEETIKILKGDKE